MGLYDKLINKVVGGIYAKKLDRDLQGMVNNGMLSEEDKNRAVSDFRADMSSSSSRSTARLGNCCSTCKYFSWGECWYFYEGNPGFRYYAGRRYDDHGYTRQIDYPNDSICEAFERDYNK